MASSAASTSSPAQKQDVGELRQSPTGERVTDKIQRIQKGDPNAPFWTFEFFPPKTSIGLANLLDRLERLNALNPSWVHVTWGAGGSTQAASLELAGAAIGLGFDVCLHLTCTNMETEVLDSTLAKAAELGIVNLLALRGDPPRGEEYWVASDKRFQHATDLVTYIREKWGNKFCIGVAGYPEGHGDSENKADDVEYLVQKQQAGAEFVVTQLFYDIEVFMEWYHACQAKGLTIPVLPGIMPIQNYQSFRRMTNLCKTSIPDEITADLTQIENDDAAVKDYGIKLATSMMRRLHKEGLRGFHLCTLNLEKSVRKVLNDLQWTVSEEGHGAPKAAAKSANGAPIPHSFSVNSAQKPVTSLRVPITPPPEANGDGSPTKKAISAVQAQRTDSPSGWDEFPNGRFGDARSPAYGDLDGWGTGLKITAPEALQQWGQPTTRESVSKIFAAYINGTGPTTPWSEEPLRPETALIATELQALNLKKFYWTVGSQPAVDGAPSSSPIHGFGPDGGYIYQKAFVEFFIPSSELPEFERRLEERKQKENGLETLKWYAGNRKGEKKGNMKPDEVNAVTWGVFAGREVVTTTLIEELSFRAWAEEAFSIFMEWSRLYPLKSPSRQFLEDQANDRWLVSIVHHDYKAQTGVGEGTLWEWLLR